MVLYERESRYMSDIKDNYSFSRMLKELKAPQNNSNAWCSQSDRLQMAEDTLRQVFHNLCMIYIFFCNRRNSLLSFSGPQLYNSEALPFTYDQYVVIELADKLYNSVTVCFCVS